MLAERTVDQIQLATYFSKFWLAVLVILPDVKWYRISLDLGKVAFATGRSGIAKLAIVLSTGVLRLSLTDISTAGSAEP